MRILVYLSLHKTIQTMNQVPVTLYAEMTPNPNTMKYVANKHLLFTGESAEFLSQKEAKNYSPLAEALFNFPFVKGVFMAANFVTITKDDSISWDFINMELREFIRDFIANGNEILVQMPARRENQTEEGAGDSSEKSGKGKNFEATELDDAIRELLEEYIRPAVESDGGAIDFKGFEDGTVYVILKGSCAGCPSSTATLKFGIENLLKQHLPEVKEVVAES
jgi:NFU1 iron-sulfur cluster scaffold homolog, mitochondrial